MIELETYGGVQVIALNRPEVKNAFNSALYTAVCDALDEAARCDEVDVVILTGRGPYFSSGADLKSAEPPGEPTASMPVGRFMQVSGALRLRARGGRCHARRILPRARRR